MPFYTFVSGQTLPASKANDLMKQGRIICTSTTRPSSPPLGMHIFETDTLKTLEWNGVRWDPPWNLPWGAVAHWSFNTTTPGTKTFSADGTIWSTGDYLYLKNRVYATVMSGLTVQAVAQATFNVELWKYSGYGWGLLGTGFTDTLVTGHRLTTHITGYWTPTNNETASLYLKHNHISTGVGTVEYPLDGGSLAHIIVLDMGSVGAPA